MAAPSDVARDLEYALREADADALLALYKAHVHSYRDERGQSLLHIITARGMFDVVENDLTAAAVNAKDNEGKTPLMVAAGRGFSLVCEELLANGAAPSAQAADGSTALAFAVQQRALLICQVLVAADPEQAARRLLQAIAAEQRDEVVLLVEAGVPPDTTLHIGIQERIALHEAVRHPTILRALLRYGASVHAKDKAGMTALALAAMLGCMEACKILLEHGASLSTKDVEGCTPMYYACCYEKEDIITHFLQLGADINSSSNKQRTALFYHAERGNVFGCELLLRNHANPNHKDMFQWTALHLASSYGHKEVCRLLLGDIKELSEVEDRQMILCRPTSSSTSWVSVTETCLVRIYSELLSAGVSSVMTKYGTLLIRDFSMNTLLHVAASSASEKQSYYIVRCLMNVGKISINIQNCFCETPLDIATEMRRTQVASVFQSLGAVQANGESEIFSSVNRTVVRRGPLFVTIVGSSREFKSCTRHQLSQLCRGIQDGTYTCTDDVIAQLDTDMGDSVIHYFLQDCAQRDAFPSVEEQKQLLKSSQWLGVGQPSRLMRACISRRNWEGKTPLHIAAELGALGFCEVLIEKGALASEECSAPDPRLLDQPTENSQFWKPINFAGAVKTSTLDSMSAPLEERTELVKYLLSEPDSLPNEENALHDCREKLEQHFPRLLPLFMRVEDETKYKEEYEHAQELFFKFLDDCYPSFQESTRFENDPSGVAVHKTFLDTETKGILALKKVVVSQCVIESTGDTLLHLVAAHGHRDFAGLIKYLVEDAGLDINQTNKQMKTALHMAVESNFANICLFLISRGADVTASCQNVKEPTSELWFTPLYSALWDPTPSYEVIETLLSTADSIAKPRNPKLTRSDQLLSMKGSLDPKWNGVVLDQLLKVHPSALPLFLDHFAVEIDRMNGEKLYRYVEVFEICQHLEQIVNPRGKASPGFSKLVTSSVTHPVVRNAIHVKWQLFGSSQHRRQLFLYVIMIAFFYLSNLLLPRIEVTTLANGEEEETTHRWIEFDVPLDYFVGTTKVGCWIMALYHLVYVELIKEFRSDPRRYWRSVWNWLDVFTYVLMLATIPFEVRDGYDTVRECLLSLLSILLCVNLMQALLVSSYFSVLIFTFARMCRVVARFLFQYLLLLLGFSGGFFLLYHGTGPYVDFFSAMRIVFLTTFGELNYSDNYHFDDDLRARNYLGFTLLTLYVIVVVVVVMNLLIALMTSEYEKCREQAEELSLLELAGALFRYEQWTGRNVVTKMYSTPKGQRLLEASATERVPAGKNRRRLFRRGLTSLSSSFSGGLSSMFSRNFDATAARSRKIDGMYLSVVGKSLGNLEIANVADTITTEVAKRFQDELAGLRVQMATQMQELKDLAEVVAAQTNQQAGIAELTAKVTQMVDMLGGSNEQHKSLSETNPRPVERDQEKPKPSRQ